MAGSISLSLSQQFDELGSPLSGGKLYFIQAGTTSTPQNAYYDADLTLPLPNPVTLDAAGRVPAFYLADGQIKVRLTSATGVTQIEQDNLLVIGPSSGGGGGGGVDPTVVFQTGDVFWSPVNTTRSGWVRANGRTIGSASSSATERANADTSALFVSLWNAYSNTICPVSGGRGASAAADFAANKNITVLDLRGRSLGGLDDMGASAASRFTSVPAVYGDAITAASVLGENLHTLTKAESAVLGYTATVDEHGGHDHNMRGGNTDSAGATLAQQASGSNIAMAKTTKDLTGITVGVVSDAGGGSHNTVQQTMLGTYFLKL